MIAVIISEFNKEIVDGLLEGCKKSLKDHKLDIIKVPGAFELPASAQKCIESERYDAVITLGCVIKGDTPTTRTAFGAGEPLVNGDQ